MNRIGRATLAVAVLGLTLGAEPAAAADPVPCDPIGGDKYECSWWRPGDGRSGGAIVVRDGKVVGYLHQGRNWITCQKEGAKVHNEDGNKNDWYGWTQSDYGGEGWVSALDAKGGDDYGKFRGVRNCGNEHGSAPSVEGRWDTTPPGGTVPRPDNRTEGDGTTPEPAAHPYEFGDSVRVNEGRRTSIPKGVNNHTQCAFGPFWPEAKIHGNIGTRLCWRYGGNRIYVKDTLPDRAAASVWYQYTKPDGVNAQRNGVCINSHGTGTWATCQLRLRGSDKKRKIKLWGMILDRDTNHRKIGLWDMKMARKRDTFVTSDASIECRFVHTGYPCTQERGGVSPQQDKKRP